MRYTIALAYGFYVLVASLVVPPGSAMETAGPLGVVGFDLWLHAMTYATLGAVLAWAGDRRTAAGLAVVVGLAAGFGVAIELLQATLAYRTFSLADAGANLAGAGLGAAGWWLLRRWWRTTRRPVAE